MNELILTKTRLIEGVWEGVITNEGPPHAKPEVEVTHLGQALSGVEVRETGEQQWALRVPVPPSAISDGVQTFIITDKRTGETLESFTILSGDALSYDIRAEIMLLREELDMLKRAFRRHCVETM